LRALEDKTCFSPTELKIINNILKNSTYDAETVKNWLDVLIGIPGKKYYGSYLNFIKDVTTPKPTYPCAKSGIKYKKLICKLKDGNLAWTDSVKPISSETVTSWPTDYIDGKVNWREAAKRITEFFKELSAASSLSGAASVEFMKKYSYPGLFNFDLEPKLSACQKFVDLQNSAGTIKVDYTVDLTRLTADPTWMLTSSEGGVLLENQKLVGQIFSIPLRVSVAQNDYSNSGAFSIKRVAIIEGQVYRFSAC
jgi:hypothetical protein